MVPEPLPSPAEVLPECDISLLHPCGFPSTSDPCLLSVLLELLELCSALPEHQDSFLSPLHPPGLGVSSCSRAAHECSPLVPPRSQGLVPTAPARPPARSPSVLALPAWAPGEQRSEVPRLARAGSCQHRAQPTPGSAGGCSWRTKSSTKLSSQPTPFPGRAAASRDVQLEISKIQEVSKQERRKPFGCAKWDLPKPAVGLCL